ncbi:hypothetical protein D9619_010412 [Psilocybe cf. subviscida]|uniref:Uncharacterized protein n=1 Tax=Psilocybe cf. subviscida TaxID=2480587 RepID=A0A8H5ESA5_9AGAR|nr:hypothetical protein D9619_010412 [Psilocybe cf. subviscida]
MRELTMLCINSGDNIVDTGPVLTDSIEGSEDGESSDDLTGGQIAHNGAESDLSYTTDPEHQVLGAEYVPDFEIDQGLPSTASGEIGQLHSAAMAETVVPHALLPPLPLSTSMDIDHEAPSAPTDTPPVITQSKPSESEGCRYGLCRKAPGSSAIDELKKCTSCDINALTHLKNGNFQCANKTCTTQWNYWTI